MRKALVLVVFAAGSCTSSSSVPVDQLAGAVTDAYCSYYAKCGLFPSASACEQSPFASQLNEDSLVQAVNSGKISYDGAKMQQCLDAIANASCDQTQNRREPLACDQALTGTVGSGGDCALDDECISGTCVVSATGSACPMGTCSSGVPIPLGTGNAGDPCTVDNSCRSGLFCDFSQTTPICAAPIARGSACTTSADGCEPGLACVYNGSGYTCQPLPATGQPCPESECAEIGDHCGTDGTCHAIGLLGAACATSSDCSELLQCDTATGTCVQGAGLGSSCAETDLCVVDGTYCDTGSSSPTCKSSKPNGSACEQSYECASYYCENAVCTPIPACF